MSNVIIDKSKIDILANAISVKSGEPVTMTLDEMVEVVDGIDTSGITPTGNIDITSAGVTDVTDYATATVAEGEIGVGIGQPAYFTESNQRKWRFRAWAGVDSGDDEGKEGYIADQTVVYSDYRTFNAVASGTSVTPTESSQTIGGANYMMEGAVTVNAIPSNYVGSGITSRSSSDLSQSGSVVTAPAGYYPSAATLTVSGGSSKNVQIVQGTTRTNASTLTAIGSELTVSKTGTYDVYYSGMRSNTSSSYTWGTQLYVGGSAYGSENTTWSNNVQNVHLTNVSLTTNQTVRVYGRNTRGTSYYVYAPTLVIVEA